jgi:hypothetical protein
MIPGEKWSSQFHLVDPVINMPVYCIHDKENKRIWYPKSASGGPGWDMNTYDDNYVYQSITELDWTDAHHFKMFASSSWPAGNGGIRWAPVILDEVPLTTLDSTFRIYATDDCQTFTTQNLGGPVTTFAYVTQFAFGGFFGASPREALRLTYFWGTTVEINYYVIGYGWVRWESWQLDDGVYVQQQVSAFNDVDAGGAPALNFPCAVPVI